MVFSQTNRKSQNILKVVEIDYLRAKKNQKENVPRGVITDGILEATPSSPRPTTSSSEDYLKLEPSFESTMFHDSGSEFFQDLVQWCSAPAKEEQVQTIDSAKLIDKRANNTDTLHTTFSPHSRDAFDANSPVTQASYYNNTPIEPLSPNMDDLDQIIKTDLSNERDTQFHEKFLDISSLPVVIGDLAASEFEASPWNATEPFAWSSLQAAQHTQTTPQNTLPFIDQDDSLEDMKFMTSVIPREVESNDIVISDYLINNDLGDKAVLEEMGKDPQGLAVDVTRNESWLPASISTPEVLNYVEQLEKQKYPEPVRTTQSEFTNTEVSLTPSPSLTYEPITPKSESFIESESEDRCPSSNKRRCDSDDSDETYTPYIERSSPRKYKRRKPNVPIKEMILALEGSQQLPKVRRGRPPKRRESNVSSACSIDDNSSISTPENKYRELRDKNNEASKRSRMNRKLKELQMEQLAIELEERNKKLKVRADILEDMTKRLKDALMTAIIQK